MENETKVTPPETDRMLTEINYNYTKDLLPLVTGLVVLMVVGIIGNILVVYVYLRKIQETAKRNFILTLAILDLIVCVLVIPFELYDIVNQVTFRLAALCKSMRVLEYVTVLSAGFVLVSVSFERYYFLCKAFNEFTPRKANFICIVCVLFACILSVPAGIFADSRERTLTIGNVSIIGHECSMNSENNSTWDMKMRLKRVYYYSLAFVFLSCFIFFIVLYTIIGRLLWKYQNGTLLRGVIHRSSDSESGHRSKKPSVDSQSAQSLQIGSRDSRDSYKHGRKSVKSKKSIIIFFSVTVVFVISFLPHIVVRILGFLKVEINSELLYNALIRSFLVSNVSNPFIYSIFNSTFRKELKKTFSRMNDALIPSRWLPCRK